MPLYFFGGLPYRVVFPCVRKTARATVWAGTVSFCMGIYHFVPYPCVNVCRMLP